MNTALRTTVVATTAVSIALGMAACGKAGHKDSSSSASASSSSAPAASASSSAAASGTIALLLPENQTTRYEAFDKPLFTAEVSSLAPGVHVDYQNAQNSAAKQAQQMTTEINAGVKVIVVDPVDNVAIQSSIKAANAKGIKVVSYDRLSDGPVDAYVSFDNEKVGELQGQGLLQVLGAKATPKTKIVEIDGAATDPNAALFKKGFQAAVKGKVDIAYDASGEWDSPTAAQKATAAINQLGKSNVAAIYSANDGMAAGIATSEKNAGINVPLTGQDAQLDGIQRIVAGTQSFTIYKAYKPEADAAAQIAVNLLTGAPISSIATTTQNNGTADVPSDLLTPVLVNKANIKTTVVQDGLWSVKQICTSAYQSACKAAGLE